MFGSFFIHIMTIHTTLHKLPVSQSQWSSIVDTRSGPSLLVSSPLDGVLYAEAGWPAYLLEIQVLQKVTFSGYIYHGLFMGDV